jgi:hypothetical protein
MPWICKKEWYLNELRGYGALSEHHLSWGGGDMHLGVKPWLLGWENWAILSRPLIHIGPFKGLMGEYRQYSKSGETEYFLGFLVSSYVLGGEAMLNRNLPFVYNRFKKFGFKYDDEVISRAKKLGMREYKRIREDRVTTFLDLLKNRPWDSNEPLNKNYSKVINEMR